MLTTLEATTRKFRPARQKAARNIRLTDKVGKIDLRIVVRLLKKIRDIKGRAWLVGGVLTEGYSNRDIDIVITDRRDIPAIVKALGILASQTHFILNKIKPPAPIILEITGTDPERRTAR